jgi:hypothetical protein
MRRVVSVSLGASSGNLEQEALFLGERFLLCREGTDGDVPRAIARIGELDGTVDAIGLGGTDLYLFAGTRRYVVWEAARMEAAARTTPVVDGSGLKNTLERETLKWLQSEGVLQVSGKRALLVAGVDRFGVAETLVELGAEVVFGDFLYGLGLPITIRTLSGLRRLASLVLPVVCRLPISLVYPTGKQQEKRVPRFPQWYRWAEIITGDGHLVRRFMPDGLNGPTVITQTVRKSHLELFQKAGVRRLITTTPNFEGQSFATNVMEGVLVTLLNLRGISPSPAAYRAILKELEWKPGIVDLV